MDNNQVWEDYKETLNDMLVELNSCINKVIAKGADNNSVKGVETFVNNMDQLLYSKKSFISDKIAQNKESFLEVKQVLDDFMGKVQSKINNKLINSNINLKGFEDRISNAADKLKDSSITKVLDRVEVIYDENNRTYERKDVDDRIDEAQGKYNDLMNLRDQKDNYDKAKRTHFHNGTNGQPNLNQPYSDDDMKNVLEEIKTDTSIWKNKIERLEEIQNYDYGQKLNDLKSMIKNPGKRKALETAFNDFKAHVEMLTVDGEGNPITGRDSLMDAFRVVPVADPNNPTNIIGYDPLVMDKKTNLSIVEGVLNSVDINAIKATDEIDENKNKQLIEEADEEYRKALRSKGFVLKFVPGSSKDISNIIDEEESAEDRKKKIDKILTKNEKMLEKLAKAGSKEEIEGQIAKAGNVLRKYKQEKRNGVPTTGTGAPQMTDDEIEEEAKRFLESQGIIEPEMPPELNYDPRGLGYTEDHPDPDPTGSGRYDDNNPDPNSPYIPKNINAQMLDQTELDLTDLTDGEVKKVKAYKEEENGRPVYYDFSTISSDDEIDEAVEWIYRHNFENNSTAREKAINKLPLAEKPKKPGMLGRAWGRIVKIFKKPTRFEKDQKAIIADMIGDRIEKMRDKTIPDMNDKANLRAQKEQEYTEANLAYDVQLQMAEDQIRQQMEQNSENNRSNEWTAALVKTAWEKKGNGKTRDLKDEAEKKIQEETIYYHEEPEPEDENDGPDL